jgi:hypothetical protein
MCASARTRSNDDFWSRGNGNQKESSRYVFYLLLSLLDFYRAPDFKRGAVG